MWWHISERTTDSIIVARLSLILRTCQYSPDVFLDLYYFVDRKPAVICLTASSGPRLLGYLFSLSADTVRCFYYVYTATSVMKIECSGPTLSSAVPAAPCHKISGGVGKLAVNKRWLCSLIHQHSRQPTATAESDPTEKQSIDNVVYYGSVHGEVTLLHWRCDIRKSKPDRRCLFQT